MAAKFIRKTTMRQIFSAVTYVAIAGLYTGPANASSDVPDVLFSSFVDEFRLGVQYHDLHVSRKRDQGGLDINAEILFRRPNIYNDNKLLLFLLNPRPHIGGSLNTAGETSQAYLGLTWDYRLTNSLFAEASFGGAIHSGKLKPTAIPGQVSPLGCRVLIRSSFSAGYELTERLRVMVTFDHIANAGLCKFNGGLSTIGARFGYKF
jgi:lipid A 3-O-deacylase